MHFFKRVFHLSIRESFLFSFKVNQSKTEETRPTGHVYCNNFLVYVHKNSSLSQIFEHLSYSIQSILQRNKMCHMEQRSCYSHKGSMPGGAINKTTLWLSTLSLVWFDRTHILNHEQYHDNGWVIQAQITNSNLFLCVMPQGSSYYSLLKLLSSQDDEWGPCRMLFGAAVINCQTFVFKDMTTVRARTCIDITEIKRLRFREKGVVST